MSARKIAATTIAILATTTSEAQSGPAPYWQAVGYLSTLKALGYLPEWAGLEDSWRFVESADGARQLVCVVDKATGARWTVTGNRERWLAGLLNPGAAFLDLWERGKPGRALPEDVAQCHGSTPAGASLPQTLGGPRYRAIVHTEPSRSAPLDLTAMAGFLLGSVEPGAYCGSPIPGETVTGNPDPAVRWHNAPGGGITLCR